MASPARGRRTGEINHNSDQGKRRGRRKPKTPPRISRAEVDAAIDRIAKRHRKVDDKHLDRLGTEPVDVFDFLHRCDGPHLPRWVRQADISDRLVLWRWMWWELQRRLLATIKTGQQLGLFNTQLGGPLGIESSQGVNDRRDRLDALLRYDRPDEMLIREERRIAAEKVKTGNPQAAWIAVHRDELHTLVERLVEQAEQYDLDDEHRESLDELVADHEDDAFTPASMVWLGLALDEIRTAPQVAGLTTNRKPYKVHTVLTAGDELRTRFAASGQAVDRPADM